MANGSNEFIWRRIHSLMGLWLIFYLTVHLLTNAQAAVWFGENGKRFIQAVNFLESLPYLHLIEAIFIGIPILVHIIWGVKRALTARSNCLRGDGTVPRLRYERNVAFSIQRWSSWILIVGLTAHVIQMRWIEAPKLIHGQYVVKVHLDDQLPAIAEKISVTLSEENGKVLAKAEKPGPLFFLIVRNAFKNPLVATLYTLFVLSAAFHALNGLWTFFLTWGLILSYRMQRAMIPASVIGMIFFTVLGLCAIWCTK
jgi:succinate dehydrogenase / fumarate reductase cytochrome b subunit